VPLLASLLLLAIGIHAVASISAVASMRAVAGSPIYLCRPAVGDGSKVAGVQTFASMPDVAVLSLTAFKLLESHLLIVSLLFYGVPTVAGGSKVLTA
jgi:hypothetical protein